MRFTKQRPSYPNEGELNSNSRKYPNDTSNQRFLSSGPGEMTFKEKLS